MEFGAAKGGAKGKKEHLGGQHQGGDSNFHRKTTPQTLAWSLSWPPVPIGVSLGFAVCWKGLPRIKHREKGTAVSEALISPHWNSQGPGAQGQKPGAAALETEPRPHLPSTSTLGLRAKRRSREGAVNKMKIPHEFMCVCVYMCVHTCVYICVNSARIHAF